MPVSRICRDKSIIRLPKQARKRGNPSSLQRSGTCAALTRGQSRRPASAIRGVRFIAINRRSTPTATGAGGRANSSASSTAGSTWPRSWRRCADRARALVGVVQFVVAVGQFHRAQVQLETFGQRGVPGRMRANAAWLAGQSWTTVMTSPSKRGWIRWVISRSSQSSRVSPTGSMCTSPNAAAARHHRPRTDPRPRTAGTAPGN